VFNVLLYGYYGVLHGFCGVARVFRVLDVLLYGCGFYGVLGGCWVLLGYSECFMYYCVVATVFWVVAGVYLGCSECLMCYFGCYVVLGGCWGVVKLFRVLDVLLWLLCCSGWLLGCC